MAISLETAALCLFLARATKPNRILDLGLGFSSFVFSVLRGLTPPDVQSFPSMTARHDSLRLRAISWPSTWPIIYTIDLGDRITRRDFHKGDYAKAAEIFFRRARKKIYLMPGWSLDQFSRSAAIVIN